MHTLTVDEAKADLDALVRRALDGETISIGRRGVPEVVLVALAHNSSPRTLRSVLTDEKGQPVRIEENFDEPLPGLEESVEAPVIPT